MLTEKERLLLHHAEAVIQVALRPGSPYRAAELIDLAYQACGDGEFARLALWNLVGSGYAEFTIDRRVVPCPSPAAGAASPETDPPPPRR